MLLERLKWGQDAIRATGSPPGTTTVTLSIMEQYRTSVRFRNVIISRGRCLRRFLCSNSDFRLTKRAMDAGSASSRLSQRTSACRWLSSPTVSGISVMRFPPSDRSCRLCKEKNMFCIIWFIIAENNWKHGRFGDLRYREMSPIFYAILKCSNN